MTTNNAPGLYLDSGEFIPAAALKPQPIPTSATGGDWMQPTTVAQRMGDVLQLLCGGKRPADDVIEGWLNTDLDDCRLQDFCATHGPAWVQGIALIDLAMVAVEQPTEGVEHELAEDAVSQTGTSKEDWVESAIRVYLIAGDTEQQARECAEYLWGELDMDDLADPLEAAMDDVEGRGPAPEAVQSILAQGAKREYPPLPEPAATGMGEKYEAFDRNGRSMGEAYENIRYFNSDQMRGYIDADRAATTAKIGGAA